jgi:hypothetical protein
MWGLADIRGVNGHLSCDATRRRGRFKFLCPSDGDVFDNFKKFNIAMFEAGNQDFHLQKLEDEPNHLRIVVDRCLNVEAGLMFDCPEIAKLGCDHDLASNPHVEPAVPAVFR